MKPKITAVLLTLVMALSLLPISAMAASIPSKNVTPAIEVLEERKSEDGFPYLYCEFSLPQSVMDIVNEEGDIAVGFDVAVKVDDGQWFGGDRLAYYFAPGERIEGTANRYFVNINQENDAIDGGIDIKAHRYSVKLLFLYNNQGSFSNSDFGAEKSVGAKGFVSSDWATDELEKADELGLIPDDLYDQDLTKPITRAEFAAVSVKVYEALSGTKAVPAVNNPFTDTKDTEVLKAYNVGITTGTSADKFRPNSLLSREEAATMLTRVFKKVTLTGWTIQTDKQFTLPYTKPAPFADDAKISAWAKDSVYFMAANGIIGGTGNNNFSPRATTPAEQARNYASATREQALAIALRMVENLA